MTSASRSIIHTRPAFWRDVRVLRAAAQIAFLILLIAAGRVLLENLQAGLDRLGVEPGFDFLRQTAGLPIGEGLPYKPTDSYGYAFWVGIVNTLRVIVVAIPLATVLGVLAGIARLSSNWLVSRIAGVYVETIRNVPLLLQLFSWSAVIASLPRVREATELPGPTYLTNRGIYFPGSTPSPAFNFWLLAIGLGLILAVAVFLVRSRYQERTGRPAYPVWLASGVFGLFMLGGWFLAPERPLIPDMPSLQGLNFKGGFSVTAQFATIVIGLVVYTGAFIAEVVRAGILAVPKGQAEAALAVGLRRSMVLRLVVLPQALRVIIPPLTNQYLNLAKNSSLGVAIGYPELFSIGGTILNQSGQAVEMLSLIMITYLAMSLITSLITNTYNRRVQFVER
ncbi:MAG TPA: ABC transporter permease subunit [Anaerolineae bacterium]|nr:ABC transporter permease subunit [Anaerolineae bacterium]